MKQEMETWWFAGLLVGMTQIANDERTAAAIRRTARETLADIYDHYAIDDHRARRVCDQCGTSVCGHVTVQ